MTAPAAGWMKQYLAPKTSRLNCNRPSPAAASRAALAIKIVLLVSVIALLNIGGSWLVQQIDFQLFPRHDRLLHLVLLGTLVIFILVMAVPFMPGIEIGLALMLMLGSKGALLVYLGALIALSVSFSAGRMIPPRVVYGFLDWLHLNRAASLVRKLAPLSRLGRLNLLQNIAPRKLAPFLLRHRYLTLAIAVNLPGNGLIGGGGGIGLVAGMSRIIPFHHYLALMAAAIAPVPLMFFLHGA